MGPDEDGADLRRVARRAVPPRLPGSSLRRIRIDPSPEMLDFVRQHPDADLKVVFPSDGPSSLRLPAFSSREDAAADHVGCPHCAVDFSVAYVVGDSVDGQDRRDLVVGCPACPGRVIVEVPRAVRAEDVVVGPRRVEPPRSSTLRHARVLREAYSSLGVAASERMAELEQSRDEWRDRARTDYATGLLSEWAHAADAKAEGRGHAVLQLPSIQAVYDECGHASGNRFARDAARIIQRAVGGLALVYRIESAKFAFIAEDLPAAEQALRRVREVLARAVTSIEGDTTGGQRPPSANLEGLLAHHPRPYGLIVRLREGGQTS